MSREERRVQMEGGGEVEEEIGEKYELRRGFSHKRYVFGAFVHGQKMLEASHMSIYILGPWTQFFLYILYF